MHANTDSPLAVRHSRLLLAAGALLLSACAGDSSVPSGPDAVARRNASANTQVSVNAGVNAQGTANAKLNKDLAALRSAMSRHHNFEYARDEAQYNFLFMDMCMVDDSEEKLGGMGLHYVNLGLLDTELEVTKPEALLYEPGPGGKLVLVAVEYAIPADQWTKDEPPVLFGQELKVNNFNLYALHVWPWKNNPLGVFAPWNPRVSCEYWNAGHSGGHR